MHLIDRLYSAEFDLPANSRSKMSYMLATVPRSGSTHFAIQLWQTGLLGAPMEYANFRVMPSHLMPRLGITKEMALDLSQEQILAYWNAVKALRTSPNGIFGYKMFMQNFMEIVKKYPGLFEEIQPDFVIYLVRKDVVAQAISYSKAIRSKVWFAGIDAPELAYDFTHIEESRKLLQLQYDYWEGVFEHSGVRPIRVFYEDIVDSGIRVVESILASVGIPRDEIARIDIPELSRQSDDTTAHWKALYLRDIGI